MLGRGLRVRGKVRGDGDLRIEGDVEGDVSVAGALDLGDGARVQGSLEGEQVTVAGRVEGEVRARGPVSIAATGSVFGDVRPDHHCVTWVGVGAQSVKRTVCEPASIGMT